jgi:hypothetical protein
MVSILQNLYNTAIILLSLYHTGEPASLKLGVKNVFLPLQVKAGIRSQILLVLCNQCVELIQRLTLLNSLSDFNFNSLDLSSNILEEILRLCQHVSFDMLRIHLGNIAQAIFVSLVLFVVFTLDIASNQSCEQVLLLAFLLMQLGMRVVFHLMLEQALITHLLPTHRFVGHFVRFMFLTSLLCSDLVLHHNLLRCGFKCLESWLDRGWFGCRLDILLS